MLGPFNLVSLASAQCNMKHHNLTHSGFIDIRDRLDNLKIQVSAKKESLEKKRAERLREKSAFPAPDGDVDEDRGDQDRDRERDRDKDR